MRFTNRFFSVDVEFESIFGFAIGYKDKEIILALPFTVIYITLYV